MSAPESGERRSALAATRHTGAARTWSCVLISLVSVDEE
jgi:hypothetical protein